MAAVSMPSSQQTARWLTKAVYDLLDRAGLRPADVGVLAVTRGPGSFTGLRIGVTFAKVFCYANSSQLVAVDTLEVIARQTGHSGTVHAVMDALRSEFFYATFVAEGTGDSPRVARLSETCRLPRDQLAAMARPPCCVAGSLSLDVQRELPSGVTMVADERAVPQATTVAELGRQRTLAQQFDDPWTLQPMYLRVSYAEEKNRR